MKDVNDLASSPRAASKEGSFPAQGFLSWSKSWPRRLGMPGCKGTAGCAQGRAPEDWHPRARGFPPGTLVPKPRVVCDCAAEASSEGTPVARPGARAVVPTSGSGCVTVGAGLRASALPALWQREPDRLHLRPAGAHGPVGTQSDVLGNRWPVSLRAPGVRGPLRGWACTWRGPASPPGC